MKLVCPKEMTERQTTAYKVCLASSGVFLPKNDVVGLVSKQINTIEEGAAVVDSGFPIPKLGLMDLVATDRNGCLLLINIHESLDAVDLCRSFAAADWVLEHKDIFKHFHPELNLHKGIRSWHLTREISPEAKAVLGRLDENSVEIFTYQSFSMKSGSWLVVRKFESNEKIELKPALSKPLNMRSVLTEAEIDEFLSESKNNEDGDDETSRYLL